MCALSVNGKAPCRCYYAHYSNRCFKNCVFKERNLFFSTSMLQARRLCGDNQGLIVNTKKEAAETHQSPGFGANSTLGAGNAEMQSFISHPFLAPERVPFLPGRGREGSSTAPGDTRLSPWSQNILAVMWHHVHLSLKGTAHSCGGRAQGQTRAPLCPRPHLALCTHRGVFGRPPTHPGAGLWGPHVSRLRVIAVSDAAAAGGPRPRAGAPLHAGPGKSSHPSSSLAAAVSGVPSGRGLRATLPNWGTLP